MSRGLRRFISRNVSSVAELELLLLFFRQPRRGWAPQELRHQLRSSSTSINTHLANLLRRGILQRDENDRYSYRQDARHDVWVQELSDEYAVRPIRIIDAIYSAPDAALSSFADAFRILPEEPNDR